MIDKVFKKNSENNFFILDYETIGQESSYEFKVRLYAELGDLKVDNVIYADRNNHKFAYFVDEARQLCSFSWDIKTGHLIYSTSPDRGNTWNYVLGYEGERIEV